MTREYSLIRDLNSSSKDNKLLIQITRLWDVYDLYNGNKVGVDMILMDEKGDQIHASMTENAFESVSNIIQEGRILFLESFQVQEKSKLFRPVDYHYKLKLEENVILNPTEVQFTFPPQKFKFMDFKDISKKWQNDNDLIDVIGYWGDLGSLQNKPTRLGNSPLRDLEIIDTEGNLMRIAFWGETIKNLPSEETLESSKPNVVIVTSTAVRKHNSLEKYHLQATFATKVYLDLDVAEVVSFKESSKSERTKTPTPKRTRASLESPLSNDKKSISEIFSAVKDINSKDFQSCTAIISQVYKHRGWSYRSCKDCMKGVKERGKTYYCFNCKREVENIGRFKLQFEIQDDSGTLDITVFSDVAESLIGHSFAAANEIVNQENGQNNFFEMVQKDVVQKLYSFNLKITNFNRQNPTSALTATKITPVENGTRNSARKSMVDEVALKKQKQVATEEDIEAPETSEAALKKHNEFEKPDPAKYVE